MSPHVGLGIGPSMRDVVRAAVELQRQPDDPVGRTPAITASRAAKAKDGDGTLVHNVGTIRRHDRKVEFLGAFARYAEGQSTASEIAGTKKARRKLRRAARRVLGHGRTPKRDL